MNSSPFSAVGPDALGAASAPAVAPAVVAAAARRENRNTPHYADEFHVYHKPKANGSGTSKRASCNHCNGDWAYNETRLKNHIIDPYRGCRKIPQHVRDRIRNAHARTAQASGGGGGGGGLGVAPPNALHVGPCVAVPAPTPPPLPAPAPMQTQVQAQAQVHVQAAAAAAAALGVGGGADALPPAKRKREPALDSSTASGGELGGPGLKLGVEFSLANGGLLRAQWIAGEIIQEFHEEVVCVSLMPRSESDNVFNIWIGGKVLWSRGPGQPLPDYVHLRPLLRAHIHC